MLWFLKLITKVWWVLVFMKINEWWEQGYSPIKQPIWCMTLNRYCFELYFTFFFLSLSLLLLWGWGLKVRRGHWKHWWGGGLTKPWLIFMSSLTTMLPELWFEWYGGWHRQLFVWWQFYDTFDISNKLLLQLGSKKTI
jgi:hypothetical protein